MDIGPIGTVLVPAVPAAQDVDLLVVVRAGKRRGANHNLSVPVPVACFGRPFTYRGQFTYSRVRGTRSLGPTKPPYTSPSRRVVLPSPLPLPPTLEAVKRIVTRATERAHRDKATHIYLGVGTREITPLL